MGIYEWKAEERWIQFERILLALVDEGSLHKSIGGEDGNWFWQIWNSACWGGWQEPCACWWRPRRWYLGFDNEARVLEGRNWPTLTIGRRESQPVQACFLQIVGVHFHSSRRRWPVGVARIDTSKNSKCRSFRSQCVHLYLQRTNGAAISGGFHCRWNVDCSGFDSDALMGLVIAVKAIEA